MYNRWWPGSQKGNPCSMLFGRWVGVGVLGAIGLAAHAASIKKHIRQNAGW
jgi:hypothetical protein